MNELVNGDTRTIKHVRSNFEYFGFGPDIIEVPSSGLGDYLCRYTKNEHRHPMDLVLHALSSAFLKHERMRERFMKHYQVEFAESSGVTIPVFKSNMEHGGSVAFSSEAFGVEVHTHALGNKNIVFDVRTLKNGYTSSGEEHETAQEILGKSIEAWRRRLSEIRIRLKHTPIAGRDDRANDSVYRYDPKQLAKKILAYVPVDDFCKIEPGSVFESFTSEENGGVQVCTVRGLPVYLRFVYKEIKPTHDRQLTLRRANALGENSGHLLMRDAGIEAEFFVRSSIPYNLDEALKDIDYAREQTLMEETAEVMYVGIWQYSKREVKRAS